MMTGRLFIDDVDVYTAYGAYVDGDGGWNDLLALPPLKSVDSNDWQEEDGVEMDLSAPVLDTRSISLKLILRGDNREDNFYDLIDALSDGALHTFRAERIGRSFRLRLVSHSSFELAERFDTLTLKLADDYPLDGYTYAAPTGGGIATRDSFKVDSRPLTDYGVNVLEGTLAEVMRAPAVKTALLRNIPTAAGALYDTDGVVAYKSKDVKVKCLLRAGSLSEMWGNYYALCHDLSSKGEHSLYVKALGASFAFAYKSCSVEEFDPTDRVWLRFTLTLTFIGARKGTMP